MPVAVYATIMFASSHVLDPGLPPEARRTLRAGTALFATSDSVLVLEKFVLANPSPASGLSL